MNSNIYRRIEHDRMNTLPRMAIPHLAIIHANDRNDSLLYIRKKMAALDRFGFKHSHYKFNSNVEDIKSCILRLNNDQSVHGIIIQSPLYNEIDHFFVQLVDLILPGKDVDGLGRHSKFVPCTALAVMEILSHHNVDVRGKHVLMIGRSKIVGEPIAKLLSSLDATVTIAHSETPSKLLTDLIQIADIVVSATGEAGLVDARLLKLDSVIIDVGINYNKDSVLCGDVLHVHGNNVNDERHYYYSPVPGGVGPVTVAKLVENLWIAYKSLLSG